jgi:glycosyltransferase involved in cell wall biosynthesis
LHRLLEIFPEVKEEVREATLDIFYRFDPWYQKARELHGPLGDRARYIGECLDRLGREGENGVRVWGPVSNKEMAGRLRETVLLPYTCDCLSFTETFSVSIMDACLAGCVPLISDEDAIGEIYKDAAVIIPGKPGRKRDEWRVNCCLALTNEDWARRAGEKAAAFAAHFDRGRVVHVWEGILQGGKASLPQTISEYVSMCGVGAGVVDKDVAQIVKHGEVLTRASADATVAVAKPEVAAMVVPANAEVVERPLRIAVILGKTGSAVHGVLDVAKVFEDDGAFATGTVTGFFSIAWGLAERGHTVDAFCECKENVVGSKLGGAHFYNIDREQVSDGYDAFITVNEPDMLKGKPKDKLKIVALWLNDFSVASPGWDEHVDVYACPSETHKLYVRGRGEVPREKLDVAPLCVNMELHDEAVARRLWSIAYCSSPDRGLHHLLAMFPEIKARVPGANLRVYYRVKPWYETIVGMRPLDGTHMRWRADQIKASFADLGEDGSRGVTLVGPVSPRRMARELRQTMVLAYPCDVVRFTEGFGAAVLDACAAGCVPVISNVDAFGEIYWGAAHLISGNPGERKKAWIDAVCLALTDDGFATEVRQASRARAREFTRQKSAARWEALIYGHMAKRGS